MNTVGKATLLLFTAVSGATFSGEAFCGAKAPASVAPVEYVPMRHPRFDIIGAAVDKSVWPIVSGLPAFSGMVQERTTKPVALADGSYTFDLNDLSFPLGEENPPGRFHVNIYPRSGIFSRMFYEERFSHDLAAYEKWKAANPGFRCFYSWEIGNDAYLPWRRPAAMIKPGREKHRLSEAKFQELKARKLPPTREAYVNEVLRPHFDRMVEWCFGDTGRLMIGEGDQCIEHLMAYWGVGEIGIETTRDYFFWQIQMMFCRGAARQFDKEWNWYIASYLSGKAGDSSFCAEDRSRLHGPNYGISQSSVKRAAYMTWLSGANSYQREGMGNTHFMFKTVSPRLSCEGEMFTNFVAFARSHDRGAPYQPIALLVPAARGYSRKGGKAFAAYDYTHPDYMLDAIVSTALDFPGNRVASNSAARIERVMANSRHGDVFDALTPDFPDQTAFRRAIDGYRAAILVGDYGRNAEMESILREYVRGGGTLVLNAMQLGGAFDAEFTGLEVVGEREEGDSKFARFRLNGAKALRSSPGGEVTFAGHRFGTGRVIVAAEHWLSPWYGDDKAARDRALADTALGAPRRFPEVEWLLGALERRFVPVSVDGFVQHGLNRTKDGWLVYLVNNSGVVKFYDQPQQVQDGGTEVVVDFAATGCTKARNLMTGDDLDVVDGKVRLLVPYGDVVVLGLSMAL